MVNLSSAMGARFAEVVTELTDNMRELGPSPLRDDVDCQLEHTEP